MCGISANKGAVILQRTWMSVAKGAVHLQRIPPLKRKWGINAKAGVDLQRWGANAKVGCKRKGGVESQRRWGQNAKVPPKRKGSESIKKCLIRIHSSL